jgi:TIR domain
MESKDALAFVNYRFFKSSPENRQKYSRAFYYVSKKARVSNLVGGGGRLWIVTSKKTKDFGRAYSLAYKLEQCSPFNVWRQLKDVFGNYGVSADPRNCTHYPSNVLTELLLDLEFVPTKPIKHRSSIGMSLMNARELSSIDVRKLLSYEDKILHGRHAFISYSSKNSSVANKLQETLEAYGHSVWRDVRSIVGGDRWESEIYRAIDNSDVLVVIVSAESASSKWVKEEILLAKKILNKPTKLKKIVPLVIDEGAWSMFGDLQEFQKISELGNGDGMKRVAQELRNLKRSSI